jgi:hypothetical protein
MDASSVFNAVAIAVAFGALIVSLLFAVRQTRIMRQANQLPVFIDMVREFRSEEFQRFEYYISHDLKPNNDSSLGVLALPEEARLPVVTILSFFGTLASMILEGFISEASAVSLLGYRADRMWDKLEPFVIGERKIRGDNDFSCYYEDFVCRVRAAWPPEKTYGLKLKRLPGLDPEIDKLNQAIGQLGDGSPSITQNGET